LVIVSDGSLTASSVGWVAAVPAVIAREREMESWIRARKMEAQRAGAEAVPLQAKLKLELEIVLTQF
jgi:hypothetical protein